MHFVQGDPSCLFFLSQVESLHNACECPTSSCFCSAICNEPQADSDSDGDDEAADAAPKAAPKRPVGRRTGVSAEAMKEGEGDWKPPAPGLSEGWPFLLLE